MSFVCANNVVTSAWLWAIISNNSFVKYYEEQVKYSSRNLSMLVDCIREKTLNVSSSSFVSFTEDSKENTPKLVDLCPVYKQPESYRLSSAQSDVYQIVFNIMSIREEISLKLSSAAAESVILWKKLLDELIEIEARALIMLTSSSFVFEECDGSQMGMILKHLESQAIDIKKRSDNPNFSLRSDLPDDKHNTLSMVITSSCVNKSEVFSTFREAQNILEERTNFLCPLLSDYRFQDVTCKIKRSIRCSCSQITQNDPTHSLNRLNFILKCLNEDAVNDSGNTDSLSSENKPHADLLRSYAWQCLYAAALSQAEHQFAHNIDSALVFASLLSGIFALHPDKMADFVSRMFLLCPALGVYSDSSGLKVMEESLEKCDPLLKWRGLARLFAALTLAHPPPNLETSRPAYFNPSLLWRVIASLVNEKFVLCGTAEVLHGLLDVGGQPLLKLYGKQAVRLINTLSATIRNSPYLKQSIPEISLLSLIETYEKNGRFSDDNGFLDNKFWSPTR